MERYSHKKIEAKWQKYWDKIGIYKAKQFSKKPKFYCLIEFPYPSGKGLHVGHLRSYSALDAIARKKRMQGFNVLYPIGWDAFGLPAENYAIKTGRLPQDTIKENIKTFKRQIKSVGLSFDWSREINTTDPKYYKWTQWIFLQFLKKGLAYQAEMPINWCPRCKTGLANEEVINGKCERCHTEVIRKNQKQWMLKITKYADKLLSGLKSVDYLDKIKAQQQNWIGKSEGALVRFQIANTKHFIEVFTTRIDTLFGVTYMAVCPDYKLLLDLRDKILNWDEVQSYAKLALKKSDLERSDLAKEKTGVQVKGISVLNPINNTEIPVWVADYVLKDYGTGAVMGVPAHDERDFEFAKKYKLPIIKVIDNGNSSNNNLYDGEGYLVNSGKFNGMQSELAREKIVQVLFKRKLAKKAVNYKLRDWIFSRQHYWGEPIPVIHCKKCGVVPVPYKDLPVKLPRVKKYKPTNTGESPLANIKSWVNVKCPKCNGPAKRETDTMPNWAGSSWYFIRYIDPHNNSKFADLRKLKYWMPVDLYNGGMEHTTLHLLYSRFWYRFLYDNGLVPNKEPYFARRSHGVVLAEDMQKMSKSRGNVINPDEIIKNYGADALRLYEMFMGPFEEAIPWSTNGLIGMVRFLKKIWHLPIKNNDNQLKHYTIKKVTEDLDSMKFNTAISCLMKYVNSNEYDYETLLKLLAPFAPHITEELWHIRLSKKSSIHLEKWPKFNKEKSKIANTELVIQVNGKMRGRMKITPGATKTKVVELAKTQTNVKKYLAGKEIRKIIFIQDRLVNFVIKN